MLSRKPKLVAFVHASNVLGTINPAKELTSLAHESGAIVLIDGAQSVPHMPVDVQEIDCDFYAFSAHKMCGPTGIGVLYGKQQILEEMPPFLAGGDMIKKVSYQDSSWNILPWKFEAGTPNIADGIAFGAAIDYLSSIGIIEIEKRVRTLTGYAIRNLSKIKGIKIFGQDDQPSQRGAVIAFTINGIHPHDIAEIVNSRGIAIRSGHHCAQPLHDKYKSAATARASLYFYNTEEEIDAFVEGLHEVIKIFNN
jgi:cysteine desulfurase/selenocysteine lyase